MEYIAGRPFAVDGGYVEPGDKLTRKQLESIPYLESFVSSGYIYPVYVKKDYDRLPPHLFTAVMQRREADAKMKQAVALVPVKQAEDQKAGDEDQTRKESASQAKIDRANLASNLIREVDPVNPIPVVDVSEVEEDEAEQDEDNTVEPEPAPEPAPESEPEPAPEPAPEPVVEEPKPAPKPTARKTVGK